MAYSEDATRIEELREIISKWPGYGVIGSRAYGKDNRKSRAMLIRLSVDGSLPKVVERAASNYELKATITALGYHPENRPKQAGAFFSPKELENEDMDNHDLLNDVIHTIDLLVEGNSRYTNLIDDTKDIEYVVAPWALNRLTRLRQRLQKS
jgi:hypothetical protein